MDLFNDTTEIWKVIPSAPSYAVSSHGRLRRIVAGPGSQVRILKGLKLDRYGYRKATLFLNGCRRHTTIHVLICEAFHGPKPSPCHQVAHRDGNRLNNAPDNLRWATPKENG